MPRDVDRRLIQALFAASMALLGLLVIGLIEPGSPDLAARAHPTVESMLSSGTAAPGGAGTLWAGAAMGLLTIIMIGICVLMGAAPQAKGLKRWTVGGTIVYMVLFSALMLSYAGYSEGGPFTTFGGLPTPSAWMVYGVWLFPWVFIAAYVFTFRTSYYPPESEERFREILRAKDER